MRTAAILTGMIIWASSLGCGQVCTEIACQNEVTLKVSDSGGRAVSVFSGEAEFEGTVISFACVDGSKVGQRYYCVEGGVTIAGSPQQIQVQIDSESGSFSGNVAFTLETWRPNGESCSPECTRGTERVDLE